MEHVMQFGGIHDNTILYYFAASPFFDPTSNNAVVFSQAVRNQSQLHIIATRQAFEARLREMSGLEYMVAQEPAESGPGMGTGVWVIRKQTRRKVKDSGGYPAPDEIEVHADYFVVGENIYMAPSLANILSFRITSIASSISKAFPAADSIKKWSPAVGHGYKNPTTTVLNTRPRGSGLESKEATPMPESQTMATALTAAKSTNSSAPDEWLAEESFAIHTNYGGEYMDENPITGKPGDFHFSSTGRKDRLGVAGQQQGKGTGSGPGTPLPTLATLKALPDNSPLSKDIKTEKMGKTGGAPKPRRRKSKGGPITPS